MEEVLGLLKEVMNTDLLRVVISNPRDREGIIKVKARPLEKKGEIFFQIESFTKTQAFHENLKTDEAYKKLLNFMENFRQMQIETVKEECTVLVSKKGKVTVKRKRRQKETAPADLSHNRKKQYIIAEGSCVPFMRDLGVMTEEGKIVRTKMDKFRQINRFLEFIEDILPRFEKGQPLTVLDFGCGKSYLTFAMYYYLHELKGYDTRIVGLDLKQDVIRHCEKLAEKYGYNKLKFLCGDIADYDGAESVDMVVTLHACDTATDYALAKAVGWNAKVILSVPCCQHELNAQFASGHAKMREELAPIFRYGLLRERFAALLTDGMRAEYLESRGYETQVLEFIDMEHTPKNILLRAVKNSGGNSKASADLKKCREFLGISPALGRLLAGKGENDTE